MVKKQNEILSGKRTPISENELRSSIEAKLYAHGATDLRSVTPEQVYQASVYAIKDILLADRADFKRRAKAAGAKKVCYLCMEFLVGRSLRNVATNIGIYDDLCKIYAEFGTSFEKVYSCEPDPGLGNGGLGRLAACFMDSLSAMDYSAGGYSLLFENGLFRQRIVDGEQVELTDDWLTAGAHWLVPRPEKSITVRFGGRYEEVWDNEKLNIVYRDCDEIKAVPYDLLIPGTTTNATNTIRLWRARQAHSSPFYYASQSSYLQKMSESDLAESITKQLYPPDNHDEGKLLRLTQQYLLVSASLQSIISDYFAEHGSLAGFEDHIAIHINDTHPALCIPELMRILMDVYSYSWEDAWSIVIKTVSYTNHTVLPEALECWRVDLFSMKLPRIFAIVSEINRRFTTDLWNFYPGDWDRISRMSVIAYNQVRMANLSVVGSHMVNGVSKLHSEILTKSIFHDFYKMTPWKFTNVTNGVVHRRWLCSANPRLCALLDDTIGPSFRENADRLAGFEAYAHDPSVTERLRSIRTANKEDFAHYLYERAERRIDPDSIFDVQIKRMHEYKRQLLNLLKIIDLSCELHDNPNADIPPQTFLFGCKAAPGYYMAKRLIKLIWFLSRELENDPLTRDRLKVIFLEEYNVSLAERIIPAADISEQISLAGKEASGTGCMKLMMNGAITLGTLDGANVEILDAVGADNIFIFGLNAPEAEELWRGGYVSRDFYHRSDRLRRAVDRLNTPIGGQDFSGIADYLIGGQGISDPFMCLSDFDAYIHAYARLLDRYADRKRWTEMSLINIARSGRFASDNSIRRYADEIWHLQPVRSIK